MIAVAQQSQDEGDDAGHVGVQHAYAARAVTELSLGPALMKCSVV